MHKAKDLYVSEMMRREVLKIDAAKNLEEARELMQQSNARIAAVFDGPKYLGLVSAEESFARSEMHLTELYRRSIFTIQPIFSRHTIGPPSPLKQVQAVIAPVERDLDGIVKIGQSLIRTKLQPAPNHRCDV